MARRSSQITLQPGILRWTRERAQLNAEDLARKVQVKPERVLAWERSGEITMAQAQRLARATYTAFGCLFLSEPPDESLPIADFRTMGDEQPQQPSPNLLDTVYAMQRRQDWMRDELMLEYEDPPLPFVGKFTLTDKPQEVAAAIRETLSLDNDWASQHSNWEDAQRSLRDRVESIGVLLVINGVVGNNTHRKLDTEEFRGFALVDEYAPLIFINNADYKPAQMFTLIHELAHIFVAETGLSNFEKLHPSHHATEHFCNITAAEFLIPENDLLAFWPTASRAADSFKAVASHFKVSTIVAARRTLDLEIIDSDTYFKYYDEFTNQEWRSTQQTQNGGDFWNTQRWRIGTRFAGMVIRAVKEERMTYKEAYSLTGLKGGTFENMAEKLGLEI